MLNSNGNHVFTAGLTEIGIQMAIKHYTKLICATKIAYLALN